MSTRSRREPLEAVRHQLRPLFDQVVVKELDPERVKLMEEWLQDEAAPKKK